MSSQERKVLSGKNDICQFDEIVARAGEIEQPVYEMVSRYLAGPTSNLLCNTVVCDHSLMGRTAKLRQGAVIPQVETLHNFWQKSSSEFQSEEGKGAVLDFVHIALMGASIRDIYNWITLSGQLTELLLGGNSLGQAERCTKAFSNFLLGDPQAAKQVLQLPKTDGLWGVIGSLLSSGEGPLGNMDRMFGVIGNAATSARKSQFLYTLSAGFAVKATTLVLGRKALEEAKKVVQREIDQNVDKPNAKVQMIGGKLIRVDEELSQIKLAKEQAETQLSTMVDSGESIKGQMISAQELAGAAKKMAALEINRLGLLMQFNTAKAALLIGSKSGDVLIRGGLAAIARNITALAESTVNDVFTVSLAAANIRAALIETAIAQSRADKARILFQYQEEIGKIPGFIREEIRNASIVGIEQPVSAEIQVSQPALEEVK